MKCFDHNKIMIIVLFVSPAKLISNIYKVKINLKNSVILFFFFFFSIVNSRKLVLWEKNVILTETILSQGTCLHFITHRSVWECSISICAHVVSVLTIRFDEEGATCSYIWPVLWESNSVLHSVLHIMHTGKWICFHLSHDLLILII